MIRHLYPDLLSSLGIGLCYDKRDKVRYTMGEKKKSFLVINNGLVNFFLKGRYDVDQEFKGRKSEGAVEFNFSIFNFQRDEDVRLKLGYEVFDQSIPDLFTSDLSFDLTSNLGNFTFISIFIFDTLLY